MFDTTITNTTSPFTNQSNYTFYPTPSMTPAQVAFGYSNSHSGTVSFKKVRAVHHTPPDTSNDAMNHASNIFHAFTRDRYTPANTLYSYLELSKNTSNILVTFTNNTFGRVPFLGVAMLGNPTLANHFLQQTFDHNLVNIPSENTLHGGNTALMWALSQAFRAKNEQALLNLKTNLLCLIDRIVATNQVETLLHKNKQEETAITILKYKVGYNYWDTPTPEMRDAMQELKKTLTEKINSVLQRPEQEEVSFCIVS